MLYTLNYRTLPGTKNCREKYETKVKENSNEKTGRLFKESILSFNEDRAEERRDDTDDQRGSNYGEINAELNRKFAKGEYFDSSEVYVEDGYLCVGEGFFRLSGKEQDALIEYLCPEEDSTEE